MSIFRQFRAVIFDHDGTLVDSEPVHLACWQQALEPFSQKLSAQQYANNLSGLPSSQSAKWLVDTFELDTSADTLLVAKQRHLHEYLAQRACPLMPDVKALLDLLSRSGTLLAVASGASRKEVERSLSYHDIDHYFQACVTQDEVVNNKPAPDIYLLAAETLGVAGAECVAIEDSDSGQRAALAAGMPCVRLDTPSQLPVTPQCRIIANIGTLIPLWGIAKA